MRENLTIDQTRAAYVTSCRLSIMLEQLQKIMSTPNAPQHPHAERVKTALEAWRVTALEESSRYIIADGRDMEKA